MNLAPRNCGNPDCPHQQPAIRRREKEQAHNFAKRKSCGDPLCQKAVRIIANRRPKTPTDHDVWWRLLARDPGDCHPFDPYPFARNDMPRGNRRVPFTLSRPPTDTGQATSTLITVAGRPDRV